MSRQAQLFVFNHNLNLEHRSAFPPRILRRQTSNPRLKFSFWERIRQESWDNTMSLNDGATDSSAYLRLRTSLIGQWRPGENWEVNLRLTNENRYYLAPKSDPKLKKNFDFNEVFVDQLNVKWKNPGRLPLTVTLGRQELMLGEGFLIFDGGPLDGSRSAYFNGLRLDYAFKNKNYPDVLFRAPAQHRHPAAAPQRREAADAGTGRAGDRLVFQRPDEKNRP